MSPTTGQGSGTLLKWLRVPSECDMSSPCQIFSMQMTLNLRKHFSPFPKNPEDFTAALIDFPSSFIYNLNMIIFYQNFDAGISFGKTVCFIEVSVSIF